MSLAATNRAPVLESEHLAMLTRQLHSQTGITLDRTGNAIAHCLKERMNYLGVKDVKSYLTVFDDSMNARAEWLALVNLLTVKETRFFRQPEVFKCLAAYVEELLTCGPAPHELSFWSAGCSTGQELFSMAMVVESIVGQHKPWLEWHGIGSDISFEAINHAQRGVYDEESLESIPRTYRHSCMDEKLGARVKVCEDIRARTHLFHSNLLHVDAAPFSDFNIISCQNVLIYFARERQRTIMDQLLNRLRIGGLLILGAGEDAGWLNKNAHRLEWPGVCAYKKIGG
ncbi:MAG: type IV pilus assembly protein PilK [Halioglobus sp.]|jgi:type IV pilus assembly protein PilK